MRILTFSLAIATLLWSCGENNTNTETQKPAKDKTIESTNSTNNLPKPIVTANEDLPEQEFVFQEELDNKLVINRISATSTALPQSKHSVYNCFDNDLETGWRTISGTGPEEGIMIYLEKPTFIKDLKILDKGGNRLKWLEIYMDGGPYYSNSDTKTSNIFIKANANFNTEEIKKDGYTYRKFENNQYLYISEIEFYYNDSSKYEIVTPNRVGSTVTASSSLLPEVAYGPSNLFDKQKENAWAENVKGNGKGETISIQLNQEIEFDEIRIWNGYQRSKEHHKANASAASIEVQCGKETTTLKLKNFNNQQSRHFDKVLKGSTITLKITDYYEGATYDDLVISEIQFLNQGTPYDFITNTESERVQKNKSIENTIFQQVIDHNLNYTKSKNKTTETSESYNFETSSILLRSNHTFVLYEREYESHYENGSEENEYMDEGYDEYNEEIIADGSWEIKSLAEDKIEIRIFGKKFEPRDASDVYKGDVTNNTLEIFQDFLTIIPTTLKGKKVVGKIPLK